jgi:uncharacterized protein YfaS (alpha-2-macroglobulin family)
MTHVDHLLDDYLHDLLDTPETRRVAEHCAACDQCREALDAARRRLAAIQEVPPTEATPELVEATLDRVREEPRPLSRAWQRTLWYALTGMAACALVLLGSWWHYSGLSASPASLVVLGQRDLLAQTNSSLRVRLFDRKTHAALAGVPVTVELFAGDGTVAAIGPGKDPDRVRLNTDASGIGQFTLAVPDLPEGDYKLRVTADTPTKPEVIEQKVRVRRSWQVMLSTDKPLYQPGQTIHLRSLVLRRPALVPVSGEKAVFTLTDPKGNVLFKETIPTSQFGLAAVDCPLASEIAEGTYTLACKVGDSDSRQPLPIQKYVLPKFAINLDFNKRFYQPGEEVVCVVKVNYTTGKPVVGGAVTLHDDRGILSNPKGETDAEGKVILRTRLPQGQFFGGDDLRLPVNCKVVDKAEQKNERLSQVLLTNKPLRVDFLPENGILVAGVANTIHVLAQQADGSPAQVHLMVEGQLDELTTDKFGATSFSLNPRNGSSVRFTVTDDNGRVLDRGSRTFNTGAHTADFLIRTDRAVYQGGQTMKLTVQGAGSEPVLIDLIREGNERYTLRSETIPMADGKGELEIDLNPNLMGTLSLLAYRFGQDAVAVQKTRIVQVLPAGELRIQATLDRDEYKPAGEARLKFRLLDADGKPRVGAISLTGVDEAVYALLPLKPGTESTFFTLEPKVLETVTSRYHWTPVSAAQETPERRSLEQAIFSSTARAVNASATIQPNRDMPVRGIPREDEMMEEPGMGGVKPTSSGSLGLLSLEADSFSAKVRQIATLKASVMRWIFCGWLVLGGIALCIAYTSLWVFLPRREALALHAGFFLLAVPLVAILVVSLLGTNAKSTFSNVGLAVGMAPEMDRQQARFGVPMEEAKGMALDDRVDFLEGVPGGAGGEVAKPRVRNYFPETLVWKPELVTDEKGEATLTLPLADSITTWRLSASAVDAQGHLGAREMPLKVFQPFFVDFNLPLALTRNDQVSIPVVVSSYLDKPQEVTLSLVPGDWYQLIAGQVEQKVSIQPGEVKAVYYRIAVRKAGTRELEVSARAGTVADAVRRPIEVVPDGRPIDLMASGSLETEYSATLNFPENVIEGSGKLLVKVYPSRFSQVVEGLDSIFRMPYGCFEQTSSTTYPNILALNYLQATRQDKPEVAAKARHYIRLGYQRLVGFEVPGGGFDWFGRPPANVTLTAYGLMEFEDMARVAEVDPRLIERTRNWLLDRRNRDGSWNLDSHQMHDAPVGGEDPALGTTAYVAWAVFGEGRAAQYAQPTRDYLLKTGPEQINDPYTLALVANALLGIDEAGSLALPYLDRLDKLVQGANDGQAYWQLPQNTRTAFYGAGNAGNIEATALATIALIQGKKNPETVRRALTWLVAQKDRNGTWYSTQATVLSLRALLAAASKEAEEPKDRTVVVKFGDVTKEIQVPKEKAEVMQFIDLSQYLTPGKTKLEIRETTKSAGYQVTYRYHLPGTPVDPNAPMSLTVGYAKTEVRQGESVQAYARIRNGPGQVAAMLLVEVPVPAGFTVRAEDFAKLAADETIARYQIEPGRVLVYLRQMSRNARLELPYTLEARQVVDTAAPGGRVYEYYDPAREAFGAPTRLKVTER